MYLTAYKGRFEAIAKDTTDYIKYTRSHRDSRGYGICNTISY